ncbi:MAG: hypothetical protein PARBB_02358 [Parabacteroides distasonis]
MKILFVSYDFDNLDNGAQAVIVRNLEMLRRCYGKDNVETFCFPRPSLASALSSLCRLSSYGIRKRNAQKLIRQIEHGNYGLVWLESSLWGGLVHQISRLGVNCTVFAHNMDALLFKQRFAYTKNPADWLKYLLAKRNEARSFKEASAVITLNERDNADMQCLYGRQADLILPISFPLREVKGDTDDGVRYCLFVGSDFFPNVQGMEWFIEQVALRISMDLWVVGRCCRHFEGRTLPANVRLKGRVDNLDNSYLSAACVVAPIFMGSGMKTKTVEAMSYGKTIIGTEEAFVGIEGDYERIGALCHTAEEFVKAINALPVGTFNPYVYKLFEERYSDDSVLKAYKKRFADKK